VGELPNPENVDPVSAVVFGFSSANKVQVLDVQNNYWQSYDLPNPATQWARYAIYFDYTASTWDFYQDGHLVASKLPFTNPSLTALSRFRASIEKVAGSTAASYLDNITVYAGPDFDQDQLEDAWERQHGFNPTLAEVDARDVRPSLASDAASGYFWETFFEREEDYRVGPLNYQKGWRASPNVAVTDDDTQFAQDALATTAYAEHCPPYTFLGNRLMAVLGRMRALYNGMLQTIMGSTGGGRLRFSTVELFIYDAKRSNQ
jgi:hypothetical protein